MPILIRPEKDSPLRQGDLLEGVYLRFASFSEAPSRPEKSLALVLSRDCKAGDRGSGEYLVIVANVKISPLDLHSALGKDGSQKFKAVNRLLATIRDGDGRPDQFYLGNLPGDSSYNRYTASLSHIHTVDCRKLRINGELSSKRIATLSIDARRHLHVRLFNSFARTGFDDQQWLGDADLNLLLSIAQGKISKEKAEIDELDRDIKIAGASGNSQKIKGLKKKLDKAKKALDTLRNEVAPYEKEQIRRKNAYAE